MQVLVLAVMIIGNGIVPWGAADTIEHVRERKEFTIKTTIIKQAKNIYIGPSSVALIRLGATYTPCMRRDDKIYEIIEFERALERSTVGYE